MSLIEKVKLRFADPKERVASISVAAAVFLVGVKLAVGLLTNSLGILSEALHSGLDLVAAVITCYAVISANKPPDQEHQFGHGKYENFSALAEALLLLGTSAWIIVESVHRIRFHLSDAVHVDWTGFAVMGLSILINLWRSRALYKAARKYNSQALEADALHFASDVYSSVVVIAGLAFVALGYPLADPLAALGVAGFVLIATVQLGRRTIDALIDKAPPGLADQIRQKAETVEGVRCEGVRTRTAGARTFVNLVISLDRSLGLESSHHIAGQVKAAVAGLLPDADVLVHVNPRENPDEDLAGKIRLIGQREKGITGLHKIEARQVAGQTVVDLHVEIAPATSVGDAHDLVSRFEDDVQRELGVHEVNTHIETRPTLPAIEEDVTDNADLVERIQRVVALFADVKDCHHVTLRRSGGELSVNLHCGIAPTETVGRAHELSTQIERAIRADLKSAGRITIHIEPAP
jgi:cation diffusion facilitator family transporter